jgi:hypothetical protein
LWLGGRIDKRSGPINNLPDFSQGLAAFVVSWRATIAADLDDAISGGGRKGGLDFVTDGRLEARNYEEMMKNLSGV